MYKECFLKFDDSNRLPMATVQVDFKEETLPWQEKGLQYTATGYGSKIPSRYMVKFDNRWRRVYSVCYSNVSTEYVIIDGEKIIVNFY